MNALRRSLGLGDPGPPVAREALPYLEDYQSSSSMMASSAQEVKQKMVGLWNAMKYSKTAFQLTGNDTSGPVGSSPVWLLGQLYHKKFLSSSSSYGGQNGYSTAEKDEV